MLHAIALATLTFASTFPSVARAAERHAVLAECVNEHAQAQARHDKLRQLRETAVGAEAAELDARISRSEEVLRLLRVRIEVIQEQIKPRPAGR